MLALSGNPLLSGGQVQTIAADTVLHCPTVLTRRRGSHKRELRDVRRSKNAAEAIAGLDHEVEIFGFTKGSFSLIDLITACLEITGPAVMAISTWTASRAEILQTDKLAKAGRLLSTRWLVDFTFARRDPSAANQIRETFGADSMRVAQNHAKFIVFTNESWRLVLRSSMNLNMNPRYEDFTLQHDPELAAFLLTIIDEIWSKQSASLINAIGREQRSHFALEG